MRFLKPLLFVVLVLVAVELTFRVYLYGPAALDPRRMDSFNQIHHSGLVRRAADPEVYFELKPNLDEWYKGERFATNSAGMRDDEQPLNKPADTFRIAVVGSSWTMGSGVEVQEIWHQQLEAQLNADKAARFELLNFGVDQYGFREIIATLEQKALRYQPDMILFAVTHYTPAVLWPEVAEPYVESARRHPFFDCHALRVLDFRLNLGLFPPDTSVRERVSEKQQFARQVSATAERLIRIEEDHGIPVVIAKLAYMQPWGDKAPDERNTGLATYPEFDYFDVTERVMANGVPPERLSVSVWDTHPNPFAHGLIAAAVLEELQERRLLPEL